MLNFKKVLYKIISFLLHVALYLLTYTFIYVSTFHKKNGNPKSSKVTRMHTLSFALISKSSNVSVNKILSRGNVEKYVEAPGAETMLMNIKPSFTLRIFYNHHACCGNSKILSSQKKVIVVEGRPYLLLGNLHIIPLLNYHLS